MTDLQNDTIKSLVAEGVEQGVRQALRDIGIHTGDDREAFELRRDFEFLRDWRQICEMTRRRGLVVVISIIITATFAIILAGIASWVLGIKLPTG